MTEFCKSSRVGRVFEPAGVRTRPRYGPPFERGRLAKPFARMADSTEVILTQAASSLSITRSLTYSVGNELIPRGRTMPRQHCEPPQATEPKRLIGSALGKATVLVGNHRMRDDGLRYARPHPASSSASLAGKTALPLQSNTDTSRFSFRPFAVFLLQGGILHTSIRFLRFSFSPL